MPVRFIVISTVVILVSWGGNWGSVGTVPFSFLEGSKLWDSWHFSPSEENLLAIQCRQVWNVPRKAAFIILISGISNKRSPFCAERLQLTVFCSLCWSVLLKKETLWLTPPLPHPRHSFRLHHQAHGIQWVYHHLGIVWTVLTFSSILAVLCLIPSLQFHRAKTVLNIILTIFVRGWGRLKYPIKVAPLS